MSHRDLESFTETHFSWEGAERRVFEAGEGPGVIVMTEVPGITPAVARFARRVVDEGFFVAMPDLFGEAGRRPSVPYSLRTMAKACISREFRVFGTGGRSPITDWCRALARDVHARRGGPGVGAVGMCLTGNFALSMMLDPCMIAPVLSQPSLPAGPGRARRADLHISPEELVQVTRRAREAQQPVLAMRFTHDILCPRARFAALEREFGDLAETIEIDSGPGNPHKNPRWAHSVLTEHLVDEAGHPTRQALERVLSFLHERLDG